MSILIFEGPEEVGKTEISTELSSQEDMELYKGSFEEEISQQENSEIAAFSALTLADFWSQINCDLVVDRFHASEWVYSNVFDRDTNEDWILRADRELANQGAQIVYCYKDPMPELKDEDFDRDKNLEIKASFEYFFSEKSQIPVIELNTVGENLSEQIYEIRNHL